MRIRVLSVLGLVLAGAMTFSLTRGQDRVSPARPPDNAPRPVPDKSPREVPPPVPQTLSPAALSSVAKEPRDFSKLGFLQKEMLFSCQRGADWLYRMNGVKGRFLYGYLPALKSEAEGDHYLRQVGAALAAEQHLFLQAAELGKVADGHPGRRRSRGQRRYLRS